MTRVEGEAARRAVRAAGEAPPEHGSCRAARAIAESITIDDFAKIDLRVAKIVDASHVEGSDKLLKLTLDAGEGRHRTVFSGIKSAYAPEAPGRPADRAGRQPRAAQDEVRRLSEGMVLAASHADEKAQPGIYLLDPDPGSRPGMRVK